MTIAAPETVLRHEADLPFITFDDGTEMQVLQVDLAVGIWVVQSRFPAGITVPTHRHTGHVYAFTRTGSWHYLETADAVNVAGSYLYEPAGSVHTLHVPPTNTEPTQVWFTIYGANLNLDDAGNVTSVTDAHNVYSYYRYLCRKQHGVENPPVVVVQ